MWFNFTGIKRYQSDWRKRLPTRHFDTLSFDIMMHLGITPSNERHIFVLGAPRSGTTLLRGIVAAHSEITTTDEETFFFCRRRTSLFSLKEFPEAKQCIFESSNKVEAFDKIAEHFKKRDGAEFFLEKTPEHAIVLPHLLRWYPESRFLFILRDGRDAYSSSFRNPSFHKRSGKHYPRLWRDVTRIFLANRKHRNLFPVYYENLVKFPEETVRKIMYFLNLNFEEEQLHHERFSNTSFSGCLGHEKLKNPIDPSSVGVYRERLSAITISNFEKNSWKRIAITWISFVIGDLLFHRR